MNSLIYAYLLREFIESYCKLFGSAQIERGHSIWQIAHDVSVSIIRVGKILGFRVCWTELRLQAHFERGARLLVSYCDILVESDVVISVEYSIKWLGKDNSSQGVAAKVERGGGGGLKHWKKLETLIGSAVHNIWNYSEKCLQERNFSWITYFLTQTCLGKNYYFYVNAMSIRVLSTTSPLIR